MQDESFQFIYSVYDSAEELPLPDSALLAVALKATRQAYAPYSRFRVGAAALLAGGQIVTGSNQENASFPAGICAERVLLSTVASQYPGEAILSMAISYHNEQGPSATPISPCGICRQSLSEYQARTGHAIRLILGGETGPVWVISDAASMLPLGFGSDDLH